MSKEEKDCVQTPSHGRRPDFGGQADKLSSRRTQLWIQLLLAGLCQPATPPQKQERVLGSRRRSSLRMSALRQHRTVSSHELSAAASRARSCATGVSAPAAQLPARNLVYKPFFIS